MKRPRLLISGGGPVGLALACAAAGFESCVLEASPAPFSPGEDIDLRVFALSPGARDFLVRIGAWDALDPRRVAPVRRMEVRGDAGALLEFAAPPRRALAWIVEGSRIAAALEAAAVARGGIEIRRGLRASAFGARAEGGWAELESGERLQGDLLVGADGPDSPARAALGLAAHERAYGEAAVVAHFETERAHGDVARQWFGATGVLAWLPLPGRRISMVWSTPERLAEELCTLDPASLAKRVQQAGGAVLGEMRPISGTGRFPLRLIRVPQVVGPGLALVGDAAHAVHPLAGQGMNLGFGDARWLAETLSARSPLERPGDLSVLRRYARARREDVAAMQLVTDGLDRLFTAPGRGPRALRNLGLGLLQTQPWAKGALAARAMR
jgi:ubiquinone biosynthesis UbiH/UbiF/VisC/COQ6 family hydroxylase